jgi:hypothetical protein
MRRCLALGAICLLAACAGKPRAPDWQMNAHDALERYVAAAMAGSDRAAAAEFARARGELASTGQPALVARAELTRCAVLLASLVIEPCTGFDALRADAPAPEQAYGDYLAGRLPSSRSELLPPQHRAVARSASLADVEAIADPLARLVAAGVLFRTGRATPQVLEVASDTASAQGWRRPLLAWLGVQLRRAEAAGATQEAQRLRRRIELAATQAASGR